MNVLYHNYAEAIGLTDSAFWLLYSLCERGATCRQKELDGAWFYAPQSMNAALEFLQQKGLVASVPENKRDRQICFTKAGEAVVKNKIAPLVRGEKQAFECLDQEEWKTLLKLNRKQVQLLAGEWEKQRNHRAISSEDKSSQ